MNNAQVGGVGVLVIQPSLSNVSLRRKGLVSAFVATPTLAFAVVEFVRANSDGAFTVWTMVAAVAGILGLVIALAGVGEFLFLRRATLFVQDGMVGMTDLWGRRSSVPLKDLECVQLTSAPLPGLNIQTPATKFVATDGTTLFSFRGKEFSQTDLQRVCDAAAVPLVGSWPTV